VQYERNRRNFNRQAAGSGLNTGTASQAALAQNSAWQRDYGNLRTTEADALTEADRQMAALETQYKSAVAQAIAENDYNRAKALMDEYGNQESRDAAMAKTLASYGDFSGYAKLYGDDAANNMAQYWIYSNPQLAYSMGKISAEEYARLTGRGTGGSGGSGGGDTPSGRLTADPDSPGRTRGGMNLTGLISAVNRGDVGTVRDSVAAVAADAQANPGKYSLSQLESLAALKRMAENGQRVSGAVGGGRNLDATR
jgi:hypothetical protein